VKFLFIVAEKAEHSITILCRCGRVTRSGFHAWQRRPESMHARQDRRLRVLVHARRLMRAITDTGVHAFTRI